MSCPETLYHACGIPVFQNVIYPSIDQAMSIATGDIKLEQCPQTGLVRNVCFEDGLVEYDADYQNEQACSPTFQAYLESTLALLVESFEGLTRGVEIGCGKGHILEMARAGGMQITGYDPA